MTTQANVQKAVIAVLKASAPLTGKLGSDTRVYDVPPSNAPLPYLSLGEVIVTPDDYKDETRENHLVQINTWTATGGRGLVKEIQDILHPIFHRATLTVGGQPAHSYVVAHRTLKDPGEQGLIHGVTQIRLTV